METYTDYQDSISNIGDPEDIKPVIFIKLETHDTDYETQPNNSQVDVKVKIEQFKDHENLMYDLQEHIDIKKEPGNKSNDDIDDTRNLTNNTELSYSSQLSIPVENNIDSGDKSISQENKDSPRTRGKYYKCDTCDRIFGRQSSLINHILIHIGDKRYICHQCDREFIRRQAFETHVLTHTGETRRKCHECDVCGMGFLYNSALMVHRRIHTGYKPYVCDLCHKAFRTSTILKKHKLTHIGERSCVCNKCHKTFAQYYRFSIHKCFPRTIIKIDQQST